MNGMTAAMAIYDCSRVPVSPGMKLGETFEEETKEFEMLSGSYSDPTIHYAAFRGC